jgi:HEAT repeat protein
MSSSSNPTDNDQPLDGFDLDLKDLLSGGQELPEAPDIDLPGPPRMDRIGSSPAQANPPTSSIANSLWEPSQFQSEEFEPRPPSSGNFAPGAFDPGSFEGLSFGDLPPPVPSVDEVPRETLRRDDAPTPPSGAGRGTSSTPPRAPMFEMPTPSSFHEPSASGSLASGLDNGGYNDENGIEQNGLDGGGSLMDIPLPPPDFDPTYIGPQSGDSVRKPDLPPPPTRSAPAAAQQTPSAPRFFSPKAEAAAAAEQAPPPTAVPDKPRSPAASSPPPFTNFDFGETAAPPASSASAKKPPLPSPPESQPRPEPTPPSVAQQPANRKPFGGASRKPAGEEPSSPSIASQLDLSELPPPTPMKKEAASETQIELSQMAHFQVPRHTDHDDEDLSKDLPTEEQILETEDAILRTAIRPATERLERKEVLDDDETATPRWLFPAILGGLVLFLGLGTGLLIYGLSGGEPSNATPLADGTVTPDVQPPPVPNPETPPKAPDPGPGPQDIETLDPPEQENSQAGVTSVVAQRPEMTPADNPPAETPEVVRPPDLPETLDPSPGDGGTGLTASGQTLPVIVKDRLLKVQTGSNAEAAAAAQELRAHPAEALAAYSAWLDDSNDDIVKRACQGLEALGPAAEPALPELAETFGAGNFKTQYPSLQAMLAVGAPAAKPLGELLDGSSNSLVRIMASDGLKRLGADSEAAKTSLARALGDKNATVSENAERALSSIGPSAVPAILASLDDLDTTGQKRACLVFQDIGPEAAEAIPQLVRMLESTDRYLPQRASDALVSIGEAAVEPVVEQLANMRDNVKARAAEVLDRIGQPAVSVLVAKLPTAEHLVRLQIINILGEIGPDARPAIPALQQAARAGGDVQIYVSRALKEIQGY